jgi:Domain of Unknown Function (DUF326)
MAKLQSQKYRTCIDACNECVEASKLCAVKCLYDGNVKSLAKCMEIDITLLVYYLLFQQIILINLFIQEDSSL